MTSLLSKLIVRPDMDSKQRSRNLRLMMSRSKPCTMIMVLSAYWRCEIPPPGIKCPTTPRDVARALCFIQNLGQGIHRGVKQYRGDRVPLPNPAGRTNVGANLPIDVDRRPATHHELHNPEDHA